MAVAEDVTTEADPRRHDVELFAHETLSKRLLLSPTVLLVIMLSIVPLIFSG